MSLGRVFLIAFLLSMAAHGGIADALGDSGPPLPQTPVLPSSAATPPSRGSPAGGTVPDAPAGSPRTPNSTPMPAPASTDHYATGFAGMGSDKLLRGGNGKPQTRVSLEHPIERPVPLLYAGAQSRPERR